MAPKDSDRDREEEHAEGPPLSSEDLDFTDDEHVKTIDDNRYVVSPDEPMDDSDSAVDVGGDSDADRLHAETDSAEQTASDAAEPRRQEPDHADPHERLREDLKASPLAYGVELSVKTENRTGTHRVRSDDLVRTVESLLLWFAHQVDDRTDPAEVLGILLAESDLTIRYPKGTLRTLVEAYDLDTDDSIGDLLDAVGDDGVEFSRE